MRIVVDTDAVRALAASHHAAADRLVGHIETLQRGATDGLAAAIFEPWRSWGVVGEMERLTRACADQAWSLHLAGWQLSGRASLTDLLQTADWAGAALAGDVAGFLGSVFTTHESPAGGGQLGWWETALSGAASSRFEPAPFLVSMLAMELRIVAGSGPGATLLFDPAALGGVAGTWGRGRGAATWSLDSIDQGNVIIDGLLAMGGIGLFGALAVGGRALGQRLAGAAGSKQLGSVIGVVDNGVEMLSATRVSGLDNAFGSGVTTLLGGRVGGTQELLSGQLFGAHGSLSARGEGIAELVSTPGLKLDESGLAAELGLQATVGAEAGITGSLNSGWITQSLEGTAFMGGTAGAAGSLQLGGEGFGAHGAAEAFVGGKASGQYTLQTGAVTGTIGGSVSYGLGAKAEGDISFESDNIGFSGKIGATVGLGAEADINISVNPDAVAHGVQNALNGFGW